MEADAQLCTVGIYLLMQGVVMVRAMAKDPESLETSVGAGVVRKNTWEDVGDRGRPFRRGAR